MDTKFENWSIAFGKDGRRGDPIPLVEAISTLGRDQTNTISLPDSSVSRVHAELHRTPDGILLKDCGSRNGVKVNGVPRKGALLQKGDLVALGIYSFELIPTGPT